MAYKVVFHDARWAYLMSQDGDVGQATARAAGRIRDRGKEFAPVRTGLLRNSINSVRVPGLADSIHYRIGTDVFYATYQEHGTGPIYPRRARALAWKGQAGGFVFAAHTRGVPAVRFMGRAAAETTANDFRR